jgi:N-methylhydantoinase B
LRANSPGGGGYGPALQRDLDAVERDLNGGYISRETAERDYGVVIAQDRTLATGTHRYTLDATASVARRKSLAAGTP